jgi:16S rRNA A1518/A1519 N6-dimethyltransferase RsmA/KsgA/DIM1 with predicted DNA glycosylase/AP lyase activity
MEWPWKRSADLVTPGRLLKRIAEQEERITALEMDMDTMRDKVLRKIQERRKAQEEVIQEDIPSNRLPKMPSQHLSSLNPFK